MYAVIETGGKQYRVSQGDVIDVEKLDAAPGSVVELKTLMSVADDGKIAYEGKVSAEVLNTYKAKKVIVYKYKAKKNQRKKQGHRQYYTTIKINSIG